MIETQDGSFFARGPTPPAYPGVMGRLTMGGFFFTLGHRLVSQLKFLSLVPLTLSHIHFNSMCHSTNGHASSAAQISSPNTKANALSTACLRHL